MYHRDSGFRDLTMNRNRTGHSFERRLVEKMFARADFE